MLMPSSDGAAPGATSTGAGACSTGATATSTGGAGGGGMILRRIGVNSGRWNVSLKSPAAGNCNAPAAEAGPPSCPLPEAIGVISMGVL